jgi:hypothetical protein
MKKPTQKLTKKLIVAGETIRHLDHELDLVMGGRPNLTVNLCPRTTTDCFPSGNVEC